MLNPKPALGSVEAAQRKLSVHHRVRKIGRVKVEADPACFRPVEPAGKLIDGICVTIDFLAVFLRIARVQIQLCFAGNQRNRLVDIGAQFIRRARASGIVSRRLNTAGERIRAVEPDDVVTLPAVHGHRDCVRTGNRGLHINTARSVCFLCNFKSLLNLQMAHGIFLHHSCALYARYCLIYVFIKWNI